MLVISNYNYQQYTNIFSWASDHFWLHAVHKPADSWQHYKQI